MTLRASPVGVPSEVLKTRALCPLYELFPRFPFQGVLFQEFRQVRKVDVFKPDLNAGFASN